MTWDIMRTLVQHFISSQEKITVPNWIHTTPRPPTYEVNNFNDCPLYTSILMDNLYVVSQSVIIVKTLITI